MQKKLLSLFVIVVVSCMFFPNCKTADGTIDIRGKWSFRSASVFITLTGNLEFTGSSESTGTVSEGDGSGTWTVSNDQINFTITYFNRNAGEGESRFSYTGTINSEKSMMGEFTVVYLDLENQKAAGTWKANR